VRKLDLLPARCISSGMSISVQSLRKAVQLAEQIESLESQLASILGGVATASGAAQTIAAVQAIAAPKAGRRKKPHFSAAARARIAAAQKARWAKVKAGGTAKPAVGKAAKKGKMSAAGRAKIVKAQKARWAKVKAAKAKAGK